MRRGLPGKIRYLFLMAFLLATGAMLWALPKLDNPAAMGYSNYLSGDIIYIQPLGDIGNNKLKIISHILDERFNKQVCILPPRRLPSSFLDRDRGQYDAAKLMEWAERNIPEDAYRYIVLVDWDIFSGRFNFIFGQARLRGKTTIISLYRYALAGRPLPPDGIPLFKERISKLLMHELGHNFGLRHCGDVECVMHFANSLADVDSQSSHYCRECREKLRRLSVLDVLSDTGDAVIYVEPSVATGETDGYKVR
jgi:archaemetzincin